MELHTEDQGPKIVRDRLRNFLDIFNEEIDEQTDVAAKHAFMAASEGDLHDKIEVEAEYLVALLDWLGDICVYCSSEAQRHGFDLAEVLDIIMDSQDSKLVDGKPLKDERDKFIKGPDYQPPEPRIKALVLAKLHEAYSLADK